MKVLVISNVQDAAEDIVNTLDESGLSLVEKEVDSVASIAALAEDAVSRGYASVIAVTDNPVGANMALNKRGNIRAAVCTTKEDARAARRNGANAIIVSSALSRGSLTDILSTIASVQVIAKAQQQASAPQPMRARMPAQQPRQYEEQEQEEYSAAPQRPPLRLPQMPKLNLTLPKLQKSRPPVQDVREDTEMLSSPRPGLMGKIKDSLGIIDVDKKQQPAKKTSRS